MQATHFEFRYRFGLIVGFFLAAFSLYKFDPVSAGEAVVGLAANRIGSDATSIRHALQGVYTFGALVVGLGALLRTWATAYLQADIVHDPDLHAKKLVADGPYRRNRNPLYLGVFLMALGLGLMASRLGYVFLLAVISIYLLRLIWQEEAELRQTQGESYAAYCRAVPGIFFAPTPRVPAGGAKPRWRQAFIGELFAWTYAVAEVVYAVTLQSHYAIALMVAGVLINAIAVWSSREGRKS